MQTIDKFLEDSNLSSKAMLVKLTIGKYQPYAYDDKATLQVEVSNGVRKAGRFNKRLLKDSTLFEKATAAYNAVYTYHMKHTVPWLDDGMRMLPSVMYFEYTTEIRALVYEAEKAADQLAMNWVNEMFQDIQRLGTLANPNDYPADIRSKFYASLRFLPVPTANDFRVEISEDDRASLNDAMQEVKTTVTKFLVDELMGPVTKLAERCEEFSGARGERWHHSLVDNVDEIVRRLPKLNVNNDPEIAGCIETVRQIIKPYVGNPDALKDDPVSRDTARMQLDAAMERMRSYMGGV